MIGKLISVDGRILRVVSRKGLVAMKSVSGRPQDLADLAKLEEEDGEKS